MPEGINTNEPLRQMCEEAASFSDEIGKRFDIFAPLMAKMKSGNATVELKKRYMLRAIDEAWVNAIEDALPALDIIIRTPSKFIEEKEKVLPIELSHNITVRSLQHLAQHTNYIQKVEGDKITPSKILNIFREETLQTYENKFINTLIYRLMLFVNRRYEIAKEAGVDEKTTDLSFEDEFRDGGAQIKLSMKLSICEPVTGGVKDVSRNYTFTTDLWKRVERLRGIVATYASSEFVQNMGQSYIRPPVMRTNAILKNKNLRQCLALWQFIENYESAGYSMLVQEDLESVDEEYLKEIYSSLALQYFIFRHNIQNEFNPDRVVAEQMTEAEFNPRVVDELTDLSKTDEFDHRAALRVEDQPETRSSMPSIARAGTLTPEDMKLLESLDVALDAAEVLPEEEPIPAPIPEPEPNPIAPEEPEPEPEEVPAEEIPAEEEKAPEEPEEEEKEPEDPFKDLPIRQIAQHLSELLEGIQERNDRSLDPYAEKLHAILGIVRQSMPLLPSETLDAGQLARRRKAMKTAIKKLNSSKRQKKHRK